MEDLIWMVVVGFIVAFVLAFGIGANDVANSFGTSVGSHVLTLRQACILATICELAGAVLLGTKVSNTIRKGIVDISLFETIENGVPKLMAGQVAALCGSCIWLLVATFFRLPVSGTHSIVGATVGFSMVLFGFRAIHVWGLVKIVASWFISPLLSGLTSVGMFYVIRFVVLRKEEPLEPALRLLPGFYGTVMLVNSFSIFYDGSTMLGFDKIPLYGVFILSCGMGVITVFLVKFVLVPMTRKRVLLEGKDFPKWTDRFKTKFCAFTKAFKRRSNVPPSIEIVEETLEVSTQHSFELHDLKPNDLGRFDIANGSTVTVDENGDSNVWEHTVFTGKDHSPAVPRSPMKAHTGTLFPAKSPGPQAITNRVFEVSPSGAADQPVQLYTNSTESGPRSLDSLQPTVTFQPGTLPPIGEELEGRALIKDRPAEARVFSFLQILTAVFGSFAHGGNDVSNAIGPLIGLWILFSTAQIDSKMPTDIWILFYGGLGISIGLWIWGRRVIQTLGEDLTKITPSSGVCIEIGAALTVLFASKLGLPISTTHCKVGSIVGVGWARSRDNVDWAIFRNIIIAWLVTLPASGCISALTMYLFTFVVGS